MNKLLPFLLCLPLLASCSHDYRIEGVSSVNNLDGRMLYLKLLSEEGWVKLDSSEVVHGAFEMKGKVDSVQMVTLYMDDQSILPLVLERGKIKIEISDAKIKAYGTSLNDVLYDFIEKKNQMDATLEDLESKEARMVIAGTALTNIHEQVKAEGDSLIEAMNRYVKTFVSDNYENVLGPSVFMMLCSSLPYPIMTPQIDDILKDAPYSFKNNWLVKEFLTKAKENMQFMEERRRLQQNISNKK